MGSPPSSGIPYIRAPPIFLLQVNKLCNTIDGLPPPSSSCNVGACIPSSVVPNPASAATEVQSLLSVEKGSKDINAAGITLEGVDLSRRKFIGCSFIRASFKNMLFTGSTFLLCFFDGAYFEACDFSGVNAQFCSFGGSEIINVSFENTELIHCNFDGSNLYDSRFIKGELNGCDLENCDLKRVYFIPAKQTGVSFKGSNTMEAIKDLEHLYL
jgi:uncharacterized protein YjbI with pentapeptide repeats